MQHKFKNKGKVPVCIHCGKTEFEVQRAPSRASAKVCKVATGKEKAGRVKRKVWAY